MLTDHQKIHAARAATALTCTHRFLREAIEAGESTPVTVITCADMDRLKSIYLRLCKLTDKVNAKAVKKDAFSCDPTYADGL